MIAESCVGSVMGFARALPILRSGAYFHTRASVSANSPSTVLISPTIAYDCANTPVWTKTWHAMATQIAASSRQAQPTMIER